MTKPTVLGIIPARGGSKGVPRKNIRPLQGKPLIAHTIEAAQRSLLLDGLIVSTDDAEIASVARDHGAEVPFIRPARFAGDTASSISVLHHAIDWFERQPENCPEILVVLPPTSPLRTSAQIDGTIEALLRTGLDSAVTIRPVIDHPYFIFQQDGQGQLSELVPVDNKPLRRQDLPSFYAHSQAVIATRTDYIRRCGDPAPLFNLQSMVGFEIDTESAIDIDTPSDFERIEQIINQRLLAAEAVA